MPDMWKGKAQMKIVYNNTTINMQNNNDKLNEMQKIHYHNNRYLKDKMKSICTEINQKNWDFTNRFRGKSFMKEKFKWWYTNESYRKCDMNIDVGAISKDS